MGRAVGSWPRRVLLLPPRPGRASRSSWAVDARAEVLEVGTHDGQSGVMLAGVEIAHIQPAHAHLVGVVGWSWGPGRDDLFIVVSGPAMASACPFVVVWRRF